MMCEERDARGIRCEITFVHQIITNSKGQPAVVHQTKSSLWSVPVFKR